MAPIILHVDSGHEWRGGQAQVLHLMRGLKEHGWQQCLVCPPDAELGRRAAQEQIAVESVPLAGEWDFRAPARVATIARRHNAALMHAHASQAHGICWRALRRLPNVPLIVTRRVDFAVGQNLLSRWKYLNSRTHYIAISSGVRDVLVHGAVSRARIAVVHSGIDPERWRGDYTREDLLKEFALPADSLLVVNVAALTDHKGQQYLIDAAAEVVKAIPQAHFLIVGEGELRNSLEKQIKARNLEKYVTLTGFRQDVEMFLAATDLFVLSSHLEGLCTSLLDALWFGKPAIGTRVGGVVDVIEDETNGLLVEAKNPTVLSSAITRLLNDVSLRESFGRQGKATVERKFTAQAMVEGTMAVYENVLRGADAKAAVSSFRG